MSTNIVQVNVTQTVAPAPATLQQSGALVSQGGTYTSPFTASLLTQLSDLTLLLHGSAAIASISQTAGLATALASVAHGLTIGDTLLLTIAGAAPAAYNGSQLCTVISTTEFTFAVPSATSSPATGTIVYTSSDVAELLAMATTFFANGSGQAVYVLELGPGNATDGVTALTTYITANPNSNYTPGAVGYFYSYLVPREWDGNASYLAFLNNFNATTSRTYFFTTTTLATYTNYTPLMKCVVAMVESPTYGVYPANALTAISWSGGVVTGTTLTAHSVVPGDWFTIAGCTPNGYNGTFLALSGTTGSTLVYALTTNPGAESVLGTLQASPYANAGVPATEFSLAAAFWQSLQYAPTAVKRVTPYAFSYLTGVTPFPIRGRSALLQTLKTAGINLVGTGAEGGISNTILLWGTTMDKHDFTYWYSVDWVQINLDVILSNVVINGSNNPENPLYYDQDGINRLNTAAIGVMNRAITFGLALAPVTVFSVPFSQYVAANPSDYESGLYGGVSITYTPNRGFTSIVANVQVTGFPAGG